jgi:hypothetical protein
MLNFFLFEIKIFYIIKLLESETKKICLKKK